MLQSVFIYADDLFILFSTGYWHLSWNGWGRGGGKKATCSHFSIPFLPTLNEDQLQDLNIFSMNLLLDCGGEIKTIEVLKWDRQQFAIGTPSLDSDRRRGERGYTLFCCSVCRRPSHSSNFWIPPGYHFCPLKSGLHHCPTMYLRSSYLISIASVSSSVKRKWEQSLIKVCFRD